MKSIWLPLALLAGTFTAPEANAQDAGAEQAIIQATKELEAARARLEQLLAREAEAPRAKSQNEIEWVTLDDVTACEAEASCDSDTQVITRAFAINGTGDSIELEGGALHRAHGLSFTMDGGVAELEDITFGLDVKTIGSTEGHEVIDLGDGRTMTITVMGHDEDVSDFFVGGTAPQMLWATAEPQSDCSGGCPECCDEPSMKKGHGGAEAHAYFFSDEGEGEDHHAFWGEDGDDMWAFGEVDLRGQGNHGQLFAGSAESDCCGSCEQGAHAAPQPRFPRGHQGGQQMGRMPRMGNGPHGMQGMMMGHGGPQGRMPRAMRGAWMGATPHQGHGLPQGHPAPQGHPLPQAHPAPQGMMRLQLRAHPAIAPQLHQNDVFFVDSECGSSCHSASSDCAGSCDSAGASCEAQCEVEVYDEAGACGSDCKDCGDCDSACESSATVECEVTMEVADVDWQVITRDQDADIESLLAELELELGDHAGSGHHVVKVVELTGEGDYDEIDALIAEIEADLAGELELVEQSVVIDTAKKDGKKDAKQARIQELETEVSELRELVESLVKELNQR